MDNVDVIIQNSRIDKTAEIVVTDTSWKIIQRNNAIGFDEEQWSKWSRLYQEEPVDKTGFDWEIAEREEDRYFKVHSFAEKYNGRDILVHHIYDVSDYAGLFRDLTSYVKEWRSLSACQVDLISHLATDPSECLPLLIKYCNVDMAVLYTSRKSRDNVKQYIRVKDEDETKKTALSKIDIAGKEGALVAREDLDNREMLCICSGDSVTGADYALYVSNNEDKNERLLSMLSHPFKLFIENSLMQNQIVFENEHDHMTKLYNKTKQAEVIRDVVPKSDSVAVYNLDVNYLKRTNDTLGHTAGNRLICKAAESIRFIERENVYGFRVGGDEFLVIAVNLSEEEAVEIRDKWRANLEKMNQEEPVPECVVACGLAYAKAPFDLNSVMEQADQRMYEDKVAIKTSRGEDPNAR